VLRPAKLRWARVRAALVAGLALAAGFLPATLAPARATSGPTASAMFPGCSGTPAGRLHVVVGRVACVQTPSRLLGGTTAFSYYVPPDCAPGRGRRCPTLYLLHGFSGDYTSMLGTAAAPSAWVAALDHAPPTAPEQTSAPWTESDPSKWRSAPALDMVLVAPDGRTTPGGYGPRAGLDGYWADWNPRYAAGGDEATYATPAPRFARYVVDELVPYVEANLPVGRGRAWRALSGTSLGGYGSYAVGLEHPDYWSSLGAVSGIMNILLLPGVDPTTAAGTGGVSSPAPAPYTPLPGHLAPLAATPGPVADFAAATYAFGDPSVDQAYYRGYQPVDLAYNALAFGGTVTRPTPSLYIRGFSNDAVPRQAADLSSPPNYLVAQGFESLVLATNLELNHAFDDLGAAYSYQRHPGIHEDAYWNPWLREQEAAQYQRLDHAGGGGSPPPAPLVFDYRSVNTDFSVWGWHVRVDRPDVEFLELSSVRCSGLTLQGTGSVTVTVPPACRSGLKGRSTFTIDLGRPLPTDAPAGTDATPVYGRSVAVSLTPIR
jgi:S-formylglutathione hydrolase FrmB